MKLQLVFGASLVAIALSVGACSPKAASSVNASASSGASFGELPDVEFLDTSGEAVTPARLKGSVWVLSLLSTSLFRDSQKLMDHLQQVQEILDGTDTRLVTLSVNPLEDQPESLARYASGFGAKPDFWFFWVGEEAATFQLIQAAYRSALVGVTPSEMSLLMRRAFESRVVAIDREGRVRGTYDLFSEDGRELLIKKLRQLNKE